MGESTKNYWLDVVMGLLALVLGVSAFVLWVVLPQGFFAARLLWLSVHKWVGLALSVVVVLHVLLHWGWLLRMTKRLIAQRSSQGSIRPGSRRPDPDWM